MLNTLNIGYGNEPKFAGAATTAVLTLAAHKLTVPIRIPITLTCAPFIVRFLRAKGILKTQPKARKTS